jgi:diguanylate cyclase (GGDEF)-like protein
MRIDTMQFLEAPKPARRICLLGDNALLARDTALQLRASGYDVTVATQLEQLATLGGLCCIVVDPASRGSRFGDPARAGAIRAQCAAPVPILWLAPLDKFDARLAAARAGVDGFLARPFDVDDLKARIETLAQRLEQPPCRVLVVASDAARLDGIEGALAQAGMEALRLHKPLELIATLSRHHPDAIVIDVDTPACNGVDLAMLIRQDPAFLDLPVLVLSDDRDPAARRRAVAAGVDDLLAPPDTRADLALAVMMRVERSRALRSLIMRDGMTGLYNHVSIKEQLLREMARSRRDGSPLALAMVDLDFFKKINDTYGHQVGDQVIRAIAHILQQRLRHGDLIGRYGGEEFAVIMPGTSAAAAGRVLDDIRALFATVRLKADETVFHATFSAGVADLDVAGGGADPADLFRLADEALYEAKHAGRNRVALARAGAGRAQG